MSKQEAEALRDEVTLPNFQSGRGEYSTPLVIVFEFEDGLPPGTGGVSVTTEFSDGKNSVLGTSANRRAGKMTAKRVFSATSSVVSLDRRTFQWPEKVALNLKYPADTAQLIKELDEIPDKPIQLARGVSWSVEAETGYEPGGDGTRYPAGVLEVSKASLDLLAFGVHVYKKGSERRLAGSYSTIRERGDQLFEIRVSRRFPDEKELDRIEFYRQRFKRTTVSDVPLRIELLEETNLSKALKEASR